MNSSAASETQFDERHKANHIQHQQQQPMQQGKQQQQAQQGKQQQQVHQEKQQNHVQQEKQQNHVQQEKQQNQVQQEKQQNLMQPEKQVQQQQQQKPQSLQDSIEFYYFSGWKLPVIHFCYVSADAQQQQQIWKEKNMEHTNKSCWFKVTFNDIPSSCNDYDDIEFVLSDHLKSVWDNPPDSSTQCRGRNYVIELKNFEARDKTAAGVKKCTLFDGVISFIKGPPVFLVTDLDGTLVGHDGYLAEFNQLWRRSHEWRGSLLVYSTGRNLKDFLCVSASCKLLKPDFAICGVGTEIYTFSDVESASNSVKSVLGLKSKALYPAETTEEIDAAVQDLHLVGPDWCPTRLHATFNPDWLKVMQSEFDRTSAVQMVTANLKGDFYINGNAYHDPFRVSVSARLSDILKLGLQQQIPKQIMSSAAAAAGGSGETDIKETENAFRNLMKLFDGFLLLISGEGEFRFLDILPKNAGKLKPIEFLLNYTGFSPSNTVVCGDSGNDVDMFANAKFKGVCVGNTQFELRNFLKGEQGLAALRGLQPTKNVLFSTKVCAGGIIDALQHFNF